MWAVWTVTASHADRWLQVIVQGWLTGLPLHQFRHISALSWYWIYSLFTMETLNCSQEQLPRISWWIAPLLCHCDFCSWFVVPAPFNTSGPSTMCSSTMNTSVLRTVGWDFSNDCNTSNDAFEEGILCSCGCDVEVPGPRPYRSLMFFRKQIGHYNGDCMKVSSRSSL